MHKHNTRNISVTVSTRSTETDTQRAEFEPMYQMYCTYVCAGRTHAPATQTRPRAMSSCVAVSVARYGRSATHTYKHMHPPTHPHTYKHMHTHIHTYTHINTQIQTKSRTKQHQCCKRNNTSSNTGRLTNRQTKNIRVVAAGARGCGRVHAPLSRKCLGMGGWRSAATCGTNVALNVGHSRV